MAPTYVHFLELRPPHEPDRRKKRKEVKKGLFCSFRPTPRGSGPRCAMLESWRLSMNRRSALSPRPSPPLPDGGEGARRAGEEAPWFMPSIHV